MPLYQSVFAFILSLGPITDQCNVTAWRFWAYLIPMSLEGFFFQHT